MSLAFNDTSTLKGIVQMYERECGFTRGDISGNTNRLKELTADVNLALDDFTRLAIQSSGTWQFDDSGHTTDYPIITTNLVASQRDYSFTTDERGNLILYIYKVLIADASGNFYEVKPKDAQGDSDTVGYWNGQNTTGTPATYDKTANGIFLDPIPSYNYTNGLKVYINREASYFTSSDTSKKPGIPGLFHSYLYLQPAREYARRNNKSNYGILEAQVARIESNIQEYFAFREKDVPHRLTVRQESNK